MGAFNDYLQAILSGQNGTIPIGGTFKPTNESFPLIPGLTVIGGSFPVPDLNTLADIPYDALALNMEVRVVNGDGLGNSVKYYLTQMPPVDTRVSEIPGYDITDFWSVVEDGGGGDPVPGPPGDKGWAPVLAVEDDGADRSVVKVVGYIGGTGTSPSTPIAPNNYVGISGYTNKSGALNVKGSQGPAASSRPEAYFSVGSRRITPPTTSFSTANWSYTSGSLQITNGYSEARRFMIFGEVPVANDSGSDSWGVRLNTRTTNGNWGPPASAAVMDENYSREDFVNANGNDGVSSVHKIVVRGMVQLAPGGSIWVRLTVRQTAGGGSKVDDGFIEAFGI